MRALLLHRDGDAIRPVLDQISDADLPDGDVLIDVAYSSLNYKDGLAVTNKGKIIRGDFPFVPGIDLSGTVVDSQSPSFQEGDPVILTGWGTGEERWGGFAERARAQAGHLVQLPEGLSLRQAMFVGTAGFTAMLAVLALEEMGIAPSMGPVVVTGASGGVGSTAVALLAHAGFEVAAVTGSPDAHEYLQQLGATTILDRDELATPMKAPMGPGRWAAAVDSVGGTTLASILGTTKRHGAVAACGLAGGAGLETTVFPFILRGVVLYGIDSNTATPERRAQAWTRLAMSVQDNALNAVDETIIGLDEVVAWSETIVQGKTRGRVVVEVKG